MENSAYLVTETMSALIILILLYANNFGVKQHSKKRSLFNWMLILNEIVVVCDAVTYFPLPWHNFFSSYLHVHIRARTPVSKRTFVFMRYYCLAEFIIVLFLSVSGKMFHFENRVFYSSSGEIVYLIVSVFSMLAFMFIVFRNARKLGLRDTVAVLPYGILTFSALAVLIFTRVNLMVTILSFNMLVMYPPIY